MSDFGLTITGFTGKSATEIKADFDAAFAAIYGSTLLVDGEIPAATSIGQEIGILTNADAAAWEQMGAIYAAFDPDQAVFPQIQILCALTGTVQKPPTFSSVVNVCQGISGTPLKAGQVVTIQSTGTRFVSQAPVTLATISAIWVANASHSIGDLIINDSSVWYCTIAGISGPASPPTTTGYRTDGTVQWYRVCASTVAVANAVYQPEVVGPVQAAERTLINIATPVTGWQAVINPNPADPGRALETIPALRARRVLELQAPDGGPADSIRSAILAIPTVEDCVVFVNDTDVAVDTIPPHAVEVLILDSRAVTSDTNQDLANNVWKAVGGGIATSGLITKTVRDASGNDQLVSFTRPTAVPIFVKAKVYFDPAIWISSTAIVDVQNASIAAVLNFASTAYGIGIDVRSSPISAAIEDGAYAVTATGTAVVPAPAGSPSIPGIVEVRNGAGADGTLPYIGTMANPVTTVAVVIGKREIATFDAANVGIVASSETP